MQFERKTLACSSSSAAPASGFRFVNASLSHGMAFGVDRLRTVTEVEGRVSSNVGLAPLGPHDLHIIDVGINMIAASIRGVDFSPGAYYDVLIYQNRDSAQVEGFAVRYPAG